MSIGVVGLCRAATRGGVRRGGRACLSARCRRGQGGAVAARKSYVEDIASDRGASYKAGVGDVRESPAIPVIEVLHERGGDVTYHDDYVPSIPELALESVPLDEALDDVDAAVLLRAHPGINYSRIAQRSGLFIDFRGVMRGRHAEDVVRRWS